MTNINTLLSSLNSKPITFKSDDICTAAMKVRAYIHDDILYIAPDDDFRVFMLPLAAITDIQRNSDNAWTIQTADKQINIQPIRGYTRKKRDPVRYILTNYDTGTFLMRG